MPIPNYSPERRREVAQQVEIDEQYLYQISKGLKLASPGLARKLHEIDHAFVLQELRPDDWQDIWPELAKPKATKKAPPATTEGAVNA